MDYPYMWAGCTYCIFAIQIESAIHAGLHHALICCEPDTARRVADNYSGLLVLLDSDLNRHAWYALQRQRDRSAENIDKRWLEVKRLRARRKAEPGLFDLMVVNSFATGDPAAMLRQLATVLDPA